MAKLFAIATTLCYLATTYAASIEGRHRERRHLFSQDGLNIAPREGPPQWTNKKPDIELIAETTGSTAEIKCPAEGGPTPTISWFKDGVPFETRPMGLSIGRRRWALMLHDLVEDDGGVYRCVVSNRYGEISWQYTLQVVARPNPRPPVINRHPRNESVYEGDKVEFECRFTSDTDAYIQWLKHYKVNGSYFQEDKTPYVKVIKTLEDPDPELLVLENVTSEDAGWYTCLTINDYGRAHESAWLSVSPRPVTPTYGQLHHETPTPLSTLILPVVLTAIVLIVVLVVYIVIHRRWRKRTKQKNHVIVMQHNHLYAKVTSGITCTLPYDPKWEFPRDKLQINETLGEGAFGRVVKAVALNGIGGKLEPITVAVKMLKDDATERELNDLIQELKVMKTIGHHVNILNLMGCCSQDGPLYMIVEYASNGNLRDFLKSRRPPDSGYEKPVDSVIGLGDQQLTRVHLINFAYQVARGMEYISFKKIVHRDLAARNVLVSENYVLKIADFGLTRNVQDNDYYRKTTDGRLPVKWMPPEALFDRKYSTKSDIWSYGVLLWEVFSLGGNPYPTVPVENLLQLLRDGHRMERPMYSCFETYTMMLKCWQFQPTKRPSFAELVQFFDKELTSTSNNQYITLKSIAGSQNMLQPCERKTRHSDSQYSSLSSTVSMNKSEHSMNDVFIDPSENSIQDHELEDDVIDDIPTRRATMDNERRISRRDSGRGSLRSNRRGSERNSVHLSSGLAEHGLLSVHGHPEQACRSGTYGNLPDVACTGSCDDALDQDPAKSTSQARLQRISKTTAV